MDESNKRFTIGSSRMMAGGGRAGDSWVRGSVTRLGEYYSVHKGRVSYGYGVLCMVACGAGDMTSPLATIISSYTVRMAFLSILFVPYLYIFSLSWFYE